MAETILVILFLVVIGFVIAAGISKSEAKDATQYRNYTERRVREVTAEVDGLKITRDSLVREIAEAKRLLGE